MDNLDLYQPVPYIKLRHPKWSKQAGLYQINTRQFTEEGTFRAAEQHLPRLKALGADILWLMPVHPIGIQNRKGTLGSQYAVRDYYGVNPEFGTLDDLKHFVAAAHAAGMYVIIDWVANHTAWDNPLVHSTRVVRARLEKRLPPHPLEGLDRRHRSRLPAPGPPPLYDRGSEVLITETDIDGYRCDVAGFLPTDFWNTARKALDAIKPVFMRRSGNSGSPCRSLRCHLCLELVRCRPSDHCEQSRFSRPHQVLRP